jgi:hypothetical protein
MRYCGGDNFFCPAGTTAPIRVHSGFYTADYSLQVCPPGTWRNLTLPLSNFTDQNILGYDPPLNTFYPLSACQLCPIGRYKDRIGDDLSLCKLCLGKHAQTSADRILCNCNTIYEDIDTNSIAYFNISTSTCETMAYHQFVSLDAQHWSTNTTMTRYEEYPCEEGYYCLQGRRYLCPGGYYGNLRQETRIACASDCAAGYYCPMGSITATQYPCGSAEYICPVNSAIPIYVQPGYYSNEDIDEAHRFSQTICPPGYYCPGDGKRYACAPGSYTSNEGTIHRECMGPCQHGYYCLVASNSSMQYKCGNAQYYCPTGSAAPQLVHEGYYSSHTGINANALRYWDPFNETCSVELPCEPGYYCIKGIKYPCQPGNIYVYVISSI